MFDMISVLCTVATHGQEHVKVDVLLKCMVGGETYVEESERLTRTICHNIVLSM